VSKTLLEARTSAEKGLSLIADNKRINDAEKLCEKAKAIKEANHRSAGPLV